MCVCVRVCVSPSASTGAAVGVNSPTPAAAAHLLLREVVFDQAAHDLLRRPGCADVRRDQAAQHMLRVADPPWTHTHTHTHTLIQ